MPPSTTRKPTRRKPTSRRKSAIEPAARTEAQSVELAGEHYVILPEKTYYQLLVEAGMLSEQDVGDIAEARRREAQPSRPYAELRQELGLE